MLLVFQIAAGIVIAALILIHWERFIGIVAWIGLIALVLTPVALVLWFLVGYIGFSWVGVISTGVVLGLIFLAAEKVDNNDYYVELVWNRACLLVANVFGLYKLAATSEYELRMLKEARMRGGAKDVVTERQKSERRDMGYEDD